MTDTRTVLRGVLHWLVATSASAGRYYVRWLSLGLCIRHWSSLLSTGLLAGRRRQWSVTSPLCRTSWYVGSSHQNSVWL